MTNKTKERDFRLEFIRGVSMLVIVLYHYSCALELKGIMTHTDHYGILQVERGDQHLP